ncbi:hypothetical protein D1K53_18390 [Salmonella enterica]|uniref:Uncharacterized protein n=1 Tax=Salmonella enterica subsp. arizonae TaxID=59203 RepID=A0A379S1T9_SALER|nr:hypothetical protein [Salmonella enterica subsp. arizonae serovar 53:z4,z23,z32:-]EAW1058532.1 hypothetical protein [Salmonella enterica]EDJ9063236.1 hypothetical protein [Salmonella enterica subsp. arizonae]EKY1893225.1 hypothetical protein [Salmonella enterica subsp. arizonae serovar 35:z4,z32:-]EAW3494314.1 hypothetical protein [Salmonella enterica]
MSVNTETQSVQGNTTVLENNPDSLLNQQILPVLSQQLLSHMAAKQKPSSLQLTWDDEEGIVLAFDAQVEGEPS